METPLAKKRLVSRKRACERCFNGKVKCEPRLGGCPRCVNRGLECVFMGVDPASEPRHPPTSLIPPLQGLTTSSINHENRETATVLSHDVVASAAGIWNSPAISSPERFETPTSKVDLVCTVDVEAIRSRWLTAFIPSSRQKPKVYPADVTTYMSRMLKAYSSAVTRSGKLPPFVHPSQMAGSERPMPLVNCLSIARLYATSLEGGEDIARDTVIREMERLNQEYHTNDDSNVLAAFQAYLIYCLILYFHHQDERLHQFTINLQEIAAEVARKGLVSAAEIDRVRPKYESWTIAEAKRRTMYIMYMFDGILSTRDSLPNSFGTELRGLPAPAGKELWEAPNRAAWAVAYNAHLNDFADGGLRIDELWPIPAELTDAEVAERRRRVDRWLESVDRYGTMLYAVTVCTHGG